MGGSLAQRRRRAGGLAQHVTAELYVQYFRDFTALIDSGQPVNADTMQPIWKNYATEISSDYES